jgi:predicted component of type VI protein secretion system
MKFNLKIAALAIALSGLWGCGKDSGTTSNPEFGTVIWDMLFEQFTEQVKEIISKDVEDIINYDPRISVNAVTVDSTEQGIRIEASITYIPFNINENMTFDFDKANSVIN